MTDPNQDESNLRSEQLDAYLDDQLSPADRQAFEELLRGDASLRAEMQLQKEVDSSLKRSFTAPTVPISFLAQLQSESQDQKLTPASSSRIENKKNLWFAIAAIAASVVAMLLSWNEFGGKPDSRYQLVAMCDLYEQSIEDGFEPKWVCEDDHQFAKTFQDRQGQALLLKPIPDGSMVGLSYLRGLSRKSTTMLARVDGKPILVFVARLSKDIKPKQPSRSSGLNLFRKELDGLVLYEVTPLDEPRVMEFFYPVETLPEPPAENSTIMPKNDSANGS